MSPEKTIHHMDDDNDNDKELNGEDKSNTEVNISEWIANAIADTGCHVVYGGHGGALVPLVNAIVKHPKLKWVCARNEHDAATMAAAHAKYEGNLGVVIATSGPGASNLTTGLMEAMMDQVPLLAITGMKPRAQLGYAEFQDIDQSKLFSGAGIEFSKSASSSEAVIPLLRDAVSIALSRRTCAHLAIPVDIQASPSPLPLKAFCAAYAHERVQIATSIATASTGGNCSNRAIDDAAKFLVGPSAWWDGGDDCDDAATRHPRTIICAGLRAIPPRHPHVANNSEEKTQQQQQQPDMSRILLELGEALNAPVLTRLHAKGVVDETHPLSFGVVGVHGKPGLEAAASLISSAERVVCVGVEDETLLVCNVAGLQIRDMIEIQPDAFNVSTRFHAHCTLLGDVAQTLIQLTDRIGQLSWKRDKHHAIHAAQQRVGTKLEIDQKKPTKLNPKKKGHSRHESMIRHTNSYSNDEFDHFMHLVGGKEQCDNILTTYLDTEQNLDESTDTINTQYTHTDFVEAFKTKTDELWNDLHTGKWKKILLDCGDFRYHPQELTAKDNPEQKSSSSSSPLPSYCHPAELLNALSKARADPNTDKISRNAAVAIDVGDVTLWSSLCLCLKGGSRTLYSERLGTMGYALCAGIAAIFANHGSEDNENDEGSGAVVLTGDGGFQMTLQELSTFQQLKKPNDKLLVIVLDNAVLGRVAFGFEDALGCDMLGPDYVALAKAYGGDGIKLDDNDDVPQVIQHALEQKGLYLIHVIVDPTLKADMASFKDNSIQLMNSG